MKVPCPASLWDDVVRLPLWGFWQIGLDLIKARAQVPGAGDNAQLFPLVDGVISIFGFRVNSIGPEKVDSVEIDAGLLGGGSKPCHL